jgi:hypothetical protein
MADMILVDYDTALDQVTGPAAKERLIEAVVEKPETLIAVLNANHTMTQQESMKNLQAAQFPFDTVIVNPLPYTVPKITYKTMFASRLQEQGEHYPVLVLDDDEASSQMWADAFTSTERSL